MRRVSTTVNLNLANPRKSKLVIGYLIFIIINDLLAVNKNYDTKLNNGVNCLLRFFVAMLVLSIIN